jgi:hypothetical protein
MFYTDGTFPRGSAGAGLANNFLMPAANLPLQHLSTATQREIRLETFVAEMVLWFQDS